MNDKPCMNCAVGDVDGYYYPCIACDSSYSKYQHKPPASFDKYDAIAETITAHGYLQNVDDRGRVAHVIRESCKPAAVQSADELADLVISEYLSAKRRNPGASYDPGILQQALVHIEADRAAQRQIGREEVREHYDLACKIFGERYADVVVEAKRVIAICPTHAELRKALAALDEEPNHAKD